MSEWLLIGKVHVRTYHHHKIIDKSKPTWNGKWVSHEHHCLRCGYDWRGRLEKPKKCPSCQNPYWNRPRVRRMRVPGQMFHVPPLDNSKSADPDGAMMEAMPSRIEIARRRAEELLGSLK
jgi:hypothetical protein